MTFSIVASSAQGYVAGDVTAAELDRVLAAWAAVQNLEERLVPGMIDRAVLRQLRRLGSIAD